MYIYISLLNTRVSFQEKRDNKWTSAISISYFLNQHTPLESRSTTKKSIIYNRDMNTKRKLN